MRQSRLPALGEVLKAWRRLPFRVPAPVAANVSHQRTALLGVATGYPRSRLRHTALEDAAGAHTSELLKCTPQDSQAAAR